MCESKMKSYKAIPKQSVFRRKPINSGTVWDIAQLPTAFDFWWKSLLTTPHFYHHASEQSLEGFQKSRFCSFSWCCIRMNAIAAKIPCFRVKMFTYHYWGLYVPQNIVFRITPQLTNSPDLRYLLYCELLLECKILRRSLHEDRFSPIRLSHFRFGYIFRNLTGSHLIENENSYWNIDGVFVILE